MSRPNRSAAPPGVAGATMRTGRTGQSAARATGPTAIASPSAKTHRHLMAWPSIAPHLARHVDDARQLFGRTFYAHDLVGFVRAREAALRADAEPLEPDIAGAIADARLQALHRFQLRHLGGHQAEHDRFVRGNTFERLECAGSPRGVFEEEKGDRGNEGDPLR